MKKIAILIVLAALLAVSPACGKSVTAQEVAEGALAIINAQETVRGDMTMTIRMEGTVDGEDTEATMTIEQSGVCDYTARAAHSEITTVMDLSGAGGDEQMTVEQSFYLLDGMGYLGARIAQGIPIQWGKVDMTDSIWDAQDLLTRFSSLIDSTQVKLLEEESIGGIPCYVIEVLPDSDSLHDFMESGMPSDGEVDFANASINNLSCTAWFAKDTSYIIKMVVESEVTVEEEGVDVTVRCEAEMLYSDHNKPVTINLPDEAANAEYIEDFEF